MAKVLIIKLGALGDVIVATPHIETIVGAHPDDELHLLTSPGFTALFENHPRLRVNAFPRKGVSAMARLLAWLLRAGFDSVYDLQGSERSAAMTLVSRASLRVGMGSALIYTHSLAPQKQPHTDHVFDRLNQLLACAGLPPAAPCPMLHTGFKAQHRVRQWLGQQGLENGSFAVFHAGSSARWISKRWPAGHFASLARTLTDRGMNVVWIGGPDDRNINRELASHVGLDATGAFSVLELVELGRQARFAVVCDSGPMHVLSASGIPVYGFFGPTDWQRSHAIGQRERVLIQPVPCSPCFLPVCPPERHHACLADLAPERVLKTLVDHGLV